MSMIPLLQIALRSCAARIMVLVAILGIAALTFSRHTPTLEQGSAVLVGSAGERNPPATPAERHSADMGSSPTGFIACVASGNRKFGFTEASFIGASILRLRDL